MASGPTGASDDREFVPTNPPDEVVVGPVGGPPMSPQDAALEAAVGATTTPVVVPQQVQPQAAPVVTPPQQQQIDPAPFTPPAPQVVNVGGVPVNPAILERTQDARAEELNAMANVAAIDADAQKKIAEAEAEKAHKIETERLVQENAAEQRRLAADAEMNRVRAAQKELDDNSQTPEESVGERIAKAIMIGLGHFGKALSGGGENGAMQVIEADRARKMQTWKAQYQRLQGKVANAQNLYAQLRQRGLDDQQAEAAALQRMNEQYASVIRAIAAKSKSPMVAELAKAQEARLMQQHAEADQVLWQRAQGKPTLVGGEAKPEDQAKLIKAAADDDFIKRYRSTRTALDRFEDLTRGGADGAAVADFIAGKGGLEQGSFGPNFIALMKKRSLFGQGVEKLREAFAGGVDPQLLKEIRTGLAMETATSLTRATRSIKHFQRAFHRAGIDPGMVVGGETSGDAAAAVGASPSAYQGRQ